MINPMMREYCGRCGYSHASYAGTGCTGRHIKKVESRVQIVKAGIAGRILKIHDPSVAAQGAEVEVDQD